MIGFLAAVLVLAQLCDDEGLFHACGTWMARAAAGRPRRLLAAVFVVASVITAVLSLDATVVLLTPVVFATAARLGARAQAARLRLHPPVEHRLAAAAGVQPDQPAGVRRQRAELHPLRRADGPALAGRHRRRVRGVAPVLRHRPGRRRPGPAAAEPAPEMPLFALATVAVHAGRVRGHLRGRAQPGLGGAGRRAGAGRPRPGPAPHHPGRRSCARPRVPFLAFVLALGIVVRAVVDNGLAAALAHLIPRRHGAARAARRSPALAAVLANLINNLPAVLVLLPLAAPAGPGAVLAVLLGVNIGPNLTYAGSLATLLWRRIVREHDTDVEPGRVHPARPAHRAAALLAGGGGTVGLAAHHRRLIRRDRHRLDRRGHLARLRRRRPHPRPRRRRHRAAARHRPRGPRRRPRRLRRAARPRPPRAATPAPAWKTWPPPPRRAAPRRRRRRGWDGPCTQIERTGRIEREVVAAAEGADLLILARDGDRTRLGPRSLGPASRFVVDHAPCPVLLVWPEPAPGIDTIPRRRRTHPTTGNRRPQRGPLTIPTWHLVTASGIDCCARCLSRHRREH